jgi:hypothetical protein
MNRIPDPPMKEGIYRLPSAGSKVPLMGCEGQPTKSDCRPRGCGDKPPLSLSSWEPFHMLGKWINSGCHASWSIGARGTRAGEAHPSRVELLDPSRRSVIGPIRARVELGLPSRSRIGPLLWHSPKQEPLSRCS